MVRLQRALFVMLAIGVALFAARAANDPPVPVDDLQRSFRLDNYTVVADSGPGRGEVIYFYKCWMCHNKYAKGGPYLQDLFQRKTLGSGQPVADETVTAK